MLQSVNEKTDFDGKVCVVQPIRNGMYDMLTNQNWIDFDAGSAIEEIDLTDELFEYIIEVANEMY